MFSTYIGERIQRRRGALIATAFILAALLTGAVHAQEEGSGSAGATSDEPMVEMIRFRENLEIEEGQLVFETETRIGVRLNENVVTLLKSRLKDVERYEIPKKEYYYRKANEYDNTYSSESFKKAIEYYNQALDIDPDFERAKVKLESCKEELTSLTELEEREAERQRIQQQIRALQNMQNMINNLQERVRNLEDTVAAGSSGTDEYMRRMWGEIRQLRQAYEELREDMDGYYRPRGYYYFYYDRPKTRFPGRRHDGRRPDDDRNRDDEKGDETDGTSEGRQEKPSTRGRTNIPDFP